MPELKAAVNLPRRNLPEGNDPASLSRWLIRTGYRFKKLCGPASMIGST